MRRPLALVLLFSASAGCFKLEKTPLQAAIEAHDAAEVARLLREGADTGATWSRMMGPAQLALRSVGFRDPASVEVLRLVVHAGLPGADGTPATPAAIANATYRNQCQRPPCGDSSAIEIVTMLRCVEAVEVLIEAGLDVRGNPGVRNALAYAAENDMDDIVRALVEAGADVNARSGEGYQFGRLTPLEAAERVGDRELADYLRAKGARP
jgi:hypothetical protein